MNIKKSKNIKMNIEEDIILLFDTMRNGYISNNVYIKIYDNFKNYFEKNEENKDIHLIFEKHLNLFLNNQKINKINFYNFINIYLKWSKKINIIFIDINIHKLMVSKLEYILNDDLLKNFIDELSNCEFDIDFCKQYILVNVILKKDINNIFNNYINDNLKKYDNELYLTKIFDFINHIKILSKKLNYNINCDIIYTKYLYKYNEKLINYYIENYLNEDEKLIFIKKYINYLNFHNVVVDKMTIIFDEKFNKYFNEQDYKKIINEYVHIKSKIDIYLYDILEKIIYKYVNLGINIINYNKYIDKNIKTQNVLLLFKYLKNKDYFYDVYLKFYQNRLLKNKKYEKKIIEYLASESDTNFIVKLEKMYNDINNPHENFFILNSYVWKLYDKEIKSVGIDFVEKKFSEIKKNFEKESCGKKKLKIMYNYSNIEIETQYTQKKYLINLNFYQFIVLNLFNNKISYVYNDICELTGLCCLILDKILDVFIKNNLLYIKDNIYYLNLKFSCENNYINLLKILSIAKNTDVDTGVNVYYLDALIVKIMKKHKKILFNELVFEIKNSCEKTLITSRIEKLIDKEYIKRDELNYNLLTYIS